MILPRGTLLARLNEASVGVSNKEILEQSNCFVFKDGRLTTFNDEIMVRVASPLDFDVVVNANNLLAILSKIPDEEIDLSLRGGEVVVKGKRRKAGIVCSTDFHLPLDAVPVPEKWSRIADGVLGVLQQAARTCGQDETQPLTTVVHITPERVEACDNYRMFRVDVKTGFPGEVLIPAGTVGNLEGIELVKVSLAQGWVHFKTSGGAMISGRCYQDKYPPGIDSLLEMEKPEKITLPANLAEMIERAEVFQSAGYDARVGVRIADGDLTITSRKDEGWYKERKRIRYDGRPLHFEVNPKFLVEVLQRTRDVEVTDRKMKIVSDHIQFVVCLAAKVTEADDDQPVPEESEAE